MSQPISQASSPASPAASFHSQQIQITLPTINLNGQTRSDPSTQPGTPTFATTSISLDPPPGVAFGDYLKAWSDVHVARWLADIRCGHHAQTFRANDIRGDVLLELDQGTLKEMGLVSVGDRIRIVSGVKNLRQKCSNTFGHSSLSARASGSHSRQGSTENGYRNRRLDSGRPAPLHLPPNTDNKDLPRIIRDGQDSARSTQAPIRPLPQPALTPVAQTPSSRTALPPLPPPPRGQPPQPPSATRTPRSLGPPPNPISGRRTPTQPDAPAFTNQPLPPAPASQHLTPTSQSQGVNWSSYDSRTSGSRTPLRSTSPLPPQNNLPSNPAQNRTSNNRSPNGTVHNRNASFGGSGTPTQTTTPKRPSTGNTPHPYANLTQSSLSPIQEAFASQRSTSTTPPPASASGNAYRPLQPRGQAPSLDDLRRKLIKFQLRDEGKSTLLNVSDCVGGAEVLERALRKFGKINPKPNDDTSMNVEIVHGGLSVEGWGAFLAWGQEDAVGMLWLD